MKRGALFISLFLGIILLTSFTVAANDSEITVDDSTTATSDSEKVNLAYNCLNDLIEDRTCDKLSLEEKIFAVLATGDCKSELREESDNDECWPEGNCDIKFTAQAILALDRTGSSTSSAEKWLLSQNQTPDEFSWYLQIDSTDATSCDIYYDDESYNIYIAEDKTIDSGAGRCLSLSEGGWWLKISPSCYDYEFDVSCDKSFTTSLLFKKQDSSTIHVSENTNSASAEGTTTEKVNSACFALGGVCDYEGSLWATLVLNYLEKETDSYIPYLTAMADEYSEVFPEVFLYLLTGSTDFRASILQKHQGQYWDLTGDKFYDTALAMYSFSSETPSEKSTSMNWLLEVQDDDGCWKGNLKNTAFILYSAWPKSIASTGGSTTADCELTGYYCMSAVDCVGNILSEYSCDGVARCCDTAQVLESCSAQGGDICTTDEYCSGGYDSDSSDTTSSEICCVGGNCEKESQPSDCELSFGNCRISCDNDEEEISESCEDTGDVCCITKTSSGNYLWIWILAILIILVLIGIYYRDKLTPLWFRIKSKFKKNGSDSSVVSSSKPRPPFRPSAPTRRPMPSRRIVPHSRVPMRRPEPRRAQGELDEVLKKLKEMGS